MSSQLLIICLQVTLLLAILLLVGRLGTRWPRWASLVGLLGLCLSGTAVVFGILGIDKPVEFSIQSNAVMPSQTTISEARTQVSSGQPATELSGFAWHEIRQQLVQVIGNQLAYDRQLKNDTPAGLTGLAMLPVLLCFAWLLVILGGHFASWLTLRQSRQVDSQSVLASVERYRKKLGIHFHVVIHQHQNIASPCVSWLWPRRIFVPTEFANWSQQEQNAALAHELAHLKHLDVLTRLLADFALLPLAWHPLAWKVRRQVIELQELATDSNAASVVGGVVIYRQCLSRLLLRMDARQHTLVDAFSVSFSTNKVVRRIKMLKRVSSALPKWRLAITSMALACLAVSTVVWGVRAEDPPKLASLPKLKKTDSQVRRISMPWNSVCPSDGYFVLRSGALVQAAPFQAFVSQLFNDDATDWPSRLADKVNFIEGNLAATVTVLPESQENGNNRTLSLGADSFNASFNSPIESAKLSSAVRWSAFGTKEQTAPLVEALAKADASARFHSVSERAEKAAQSLDTELQNRLQKMWAEIDVGEATFITVNPLKVDHFENDSEESLALLEKIESAGASYTPDKSMFQGTIKIGVCLKSDEQAAKWLTNIKSVLGESEDGEAVKVSKVLSSLKATIKPLESGELIVLEGPINFLQL